MRTLTSFTGARWLRGGLAVLFLVVGLVQKEPVALLASAFFGLQALFNVGCCGAVCIPSSTRSASRTDEVTYEELK